MSLSVNSLLERSLVILQDAGATRWPDAERLDWLNDGLRELAALKPDACVKRAVQSLVPGAKQALPANSLFLIGVESAAGVTVIPCVRSVLDAFCPNWMAVPGKTVNNFMYSPLDPKVFYIYPAQADASVSVTLIYSAYPDPAIAGGTLDVQDKYVNALLDYVLFRAYSKDAEFAGAAQLAAAYYQSFAK
jgi:hypothetical protein